MWLSVVIPTFDRRADLLRTLEAYERQAPAELRFELIVVDDGSSDGTADALAAYRPRRYPLRFLTQPNAGPATARNRGLQAATGDLILITGDDIEPAPDLLAQHVAGHQRLNRPDAAIVGLTRWPKDLRITATMRHIDGPGAQQFSYHYFEDGAEYDFRHLYTSNISMPRTLLEKEPAGFATAFPSAAFEDTELGHRLAFHGLRIYYRESAVAEHHHPYGARDFYRRQVRCGRMAALLLERNPELGKWLSSREIRHRRLELLALPSDEESLLAALISGFGLWRRRAIQVAERFDHDGAPGLDPLLRALFHLGYVEGLAAALCGDSGGRRVAAAVLADQVGPAARGLRRALGSAGWPRLFSDLEALAGLPKLG